MDKIVIIANFHIYVSQGLNPDGTDKPAKRVVYTNGMVIDAADMPEGHAAASWIEKELATAA